MTGPDAPFPVRRIVIALESICDNLKALEIAADMAARMKVELHGIFIEDVNLLSAARLPFVRQISLHSPLIRNFEPADIEAQFRTMAMHAKEALAGQASRMNLPWSFTIHRGDRSSLASATERSDLLVVETATKPFARYMKLPTDWSEISLRSDRACLLLTAPVSRRKGILVIHDGTAAGERAMAAAAALDGTVQPLVIAALATENNKGTLPTTLRVAGTGADLHSIEILNSAELLRVIARTDCNLVIMPARLAVEHRSALQDLLIAPPCALLLVQ